MQELMVSTLRSLPVFEELDIASARELASHCEGVDLPQDSVLFAEDEPADCMYVVLAGSIRLSCLSPVGEPVMVGMAQPGSVIGEMGVLDGSPRSSTATAAGHAGVLKVEGASFLAMIRSGQPAAWSILHVIRTTLSERLRTLDSRVDHVMTTAQTSGAMPGEPMRSAVDGLHKALGGKE